METGLYLTAVFEITFLVVLSIPVALLFLSPVLIYIFQKRRNTIFEKIAIKYNFQIRKEKMFPLGTVENASKNNQAVRACEGELDGKKITIGDFYYSSWLGNLIGEWTISAKFSVSLRGAPYGVHTLLVLNGDRQDIGSPMTGYASERKMFEVLDALKFK